MPVRRKPSWRAIVAEQAVGLLRIVAGVWLAVLAAAITIPACVACVGQLLAGASLSFGW